MALAALEVVLLADPEVVEVSDLSATPPTPVELVQMSLPKTLALELKVISAH